MNRIFRFVAGVLLLGARPAFAQQNGERVIDDFESTSAWKTTPSDGVSLELKQDSGMNGRSMRLDFDFHGHGGYAVIHRDVSFTVPQNYEFSFSIRGNAPVNTLEFKLVDSSGDNVWWSNQPGFAFPKEWTRVVRKKRQITFAWGPLGGGELKQVAAIEIAVTAGTGGKGSVWLDDLRLTPLEPEGPYTLTPRTERRFDVQSGNATLEIDFLKRREFGGVVIDWRNASRPTWYTVSASTDGTTYTQVDSIGTSSRRRDYLYLPESDARYIRFEAKGTGANDPFRTLGVKDIVIEPLSWSASMNDFLAAVARYAPTGNYPRYLSNKQSYWTVVGVNGDTHEGLLDTQGRLESGKAGFSIEPFLDRPNGGVVSWADVRTTPSDAGGQVPIPSVHWSPSPLELTVTAFAAGDPGKSFLIGKYRLHNPTAKSQRTTLHLAIRPFQVNPPWQFLNTPGGFARIDSISYDRNQVRVNADRTVIPVSRPAGFHALSFAQSDLLDAIKRSLPFLNTKASDKLGLASGVLSYALDIPAGGDSVIYVAVPLHESPPPCVRDRGITACTPEWAAAQMDAVKRSWSAELGIVSIALPSSAGRVSESLRANLAYILINRDGPAIQPGSRSYERSWIRDGSLTSTALLRLGHYSEVREFLDWYAGFQFENGKIPCCVDARGSDPVPENDSHGEFIYLVAEYFRHTGDTATLTRMWPHVAKAFTFMDSLRESRRTSEFQSADKRVFFGLLPQSISHEGYSAKPMHSYWDDFFALRGFKDAAFIAQVLRKPELTRFCAARDTFQVDLHRSIELAMKNHNIDYVPGAAELGDFDATSTTVGVDPAEELGTTIEPAIRRTFDRYYENFRKRRDGGKPWEIYTPYEWRVAGTFVRLGQRERARELMNFFFQGQRPKEWHQWAEVVWEKKDTARFIGDMPHTWVGSDFIRSTLDMFAYERDSDSSLVIAAGLPESWLRENNGVSIKGLSTHYGRLSYSMRARGNVLSVSIQDRMRIPLGGVVIEPPMHGKPKRILLNGVSMPVLDRIRVTSLPAVLSITY